MFEMLLQFLRFWFPRVKFWRPRVTLRSDLPAVRPRPPVLCVPPRRDQKGRPLVVCADKRPLWQIRTWRREGRQLVGAFRTPRGSIAGRITLDRGGRPHEYFLINPPASLLNGPKKPCFRSRGKKLYWVHFSNLPRELDGGIVAIESLIRDALA